MADLIDKSKVIQSFCAECANMGSFICISCTIPKIVKEIPKIEAEPVRHGRWIPTEYDSYADGAPVWDKWECSECGHEHKGEEDSLTAFCPGCGARMDGGAEDADRGCI